MNNNNLRGPPGPRGPCLRDLAELGPAELRVPPVGVDPAAAAVEELGRAGVPPVAVDSRAANEAELGRAGVPPVAVDSRAANVANAATVLTVQNSWAIWN